jgi:hypothetical protein
MRFFVYNLNIAPWYNFFMLSLVIDIQSDVIEGTLIKFPPKGTPAPPQILYSASLHIPRKPNTDGDYITKMMLRTIEELSLGVVKEMRGVTQEPIQSIHYILSSPWVVSNSKTIQIEYPNDTTITAKTVNEVIEADRKDLIAKNAPDMVFVEQKIFDVELNGYSIAHYEGKTAKHLKISFAFTLSSEHIIKKIQSAIAKNIHVKHEYFHSAILLQYLSSRSMMGEGEEYIVLHVHGELTDVVVVKKGFSSYLASFPFGTSTLIRKVCNSLKTSYETTSSMLTMYMEKKLNDEEQKKIETVLMQVLKGWHAECTQTFNGIGEHVALPRHIHLYSGKPFAPLFKIILDQANFETLIHDEPLREVHSFALKDVI